MCWQILTDPLFRFDFYAKSRTSTDLRRRVEQLTRGVEKELAKPLAKEREKRRNAEQAAEEAFMAKQRALLPAPRRKRPAPKGKGKKQRKRRKA